MLRRIRPPGMTAVSAPSAESAARRTKSPSPFSTARRFEFARYFLFAAVDELFDPGAAEVSIELGDSYRTARIDAHETGETTAREIEGERLQEQYAVLETYVS